MRILHVLDHSLPLQSGYTFRTRAILKAQQAKGWDVAAVTGVRHFAAGPPVETVDGLTFHRTPAPGRSLPVLNEWREVAALARSAARVADDFAPDILHAHSPVLSALAARRVARHRNIPLVYEIRAFWEDAAVGNGTGIEGSLRYRATRALETRAAKHADAIAVICEGLRNDLVARGVSPDKVFVAPNGVDLTMFGTPAKRDASLARELALGAETIGFIGSFYDYEGIDTLIAAMPRLTALRPGLKLVLVGGGPVEAQLRRQAEASRAADNIHFIGRVPHEQVERYYGLLDIMVYPRKAMRLTELVTPLKPLEAMAQGRLVAASNVGGHRELIEDGITGVLFPPDDPNRLAETLAAMFAARNHWDVMRATARAFVERDRNWASNIYRYDAVYQELAKRREKDE